MLARRALIGFLSILILSSVVFCQSQMSEKSTKNETSNKFHAVGTTRPIVQYLETPSSQVPRQLKRVAVEVKFDQLPTMMRFSMPCYPAMVTENGIHYSNGWTETYDPKASSSCEILWDNKARYARMWIESQNPARIIVRWRAALADPDGYIAHSDIPSGSPYGPGDWTDEWYYIYPDGMHTRHVRIYTGLAEQSHLVTDQTFEGLVPIREIPPNVVHEFHEEFIFGQNGHLPEDDIEASPQTLIMMDGRSKTISYQPYPKEFGEFASANIKVINLKSEYRPYIICIPHGIENEPYPPEGPLPHIFQTWPREPKANGYSTSLGHILNWWHYYRSDNKLEQVYLSGMIKSEDPAKDLLPLAKSWLRPPQLKMNGLNPKYKVHIYDQSQRAYIIRRSDDGPEKLKFALDEYNDPESESQAPVWIFNPAFIIKNWGNSEVELKVNSKLLTSGKDFFIGYEKTHTGTDMVIWLKAKSQKAMTFEIIPNDSE
jgi:hypothetical protein